MRRRFLRLTTAVFTTVARVELRLTPLRAILRVLIDYSPVGASSGRAGLAASRRQARLSQARRSRGVLVQRLRGEVGSSSLELVAVWVHDGRVEKKRVGAHTLTPGSRGIRLAVRAAASDLPSPGWSRRRLPAGRPREGSVARRGPRPRKRGPRRDCLPCREPTSLRCCAR
jgi:hypothetical protein